MKELDRVAQAAQKAARARAERNDSIRQAVAAGASLRAVGAAARLTHTQVRRIVLAKAGSRTLD
jgi:hypothetical protein